MGVRLLILVVIAGGLAVYFAVAKKPVPTAEPERDMVAMGSNGSVGDLQAIRAVQRTVAEQDIGGEEPAIPPDLHVDVEVDTSSGKNRLYFTISESHGYYLDTFNLVAWRVDDDATIPEDSVLAVPVYLNLYKQANQTLRTCVEVVPAELSKVGGDIGTTKDWDVMLTYYGRAREKDPDKLPVISDVGQCH